MAKDLPIKLYNSLRNFLDFYRYPDEEVLVLEAIANAIDAKANKVDICFSREQKGDFVSFHNDARGMTKKEFENYHYVSLSSKTKGRSIGFAGVGAKIYLAAWENAEIITITRGEDGVLASRMYRVGEDIKYETSIDVSLTKIAGNMDFSNVKGTIYKVRLDPERFIPLRNDIEGVLQRWFSYAMMNGLRIDVDGKHITASKLKGRTISRTVQYKGSKIPCDFILSDEDIPEDDRHIVYTVFGKRIKSEPFEFSYQITENRSRRVCCIADVSVLAEFLTANKEEFDKEGFYPARAKIKQAFYKFLKDEGLIKEQEQLESANIVVNELTKRLDKLLKLPEFKFLNPRSKLSIERPQIIQDNNGDKVISEVPDAQQIPNGGNELAGELEGNGGDGGNDGIGRDLVGKGDRTTGSGDDHVGGDEEDRRIDTAGNTAGSGYIEDEEGSDTGREITRRSRGLAIVVTDQHPDDPREGWVQPEINAVVYNSVHPFAKKFQQASLFDYNLNRVVIATLIKYSNERNPMETQKAFDTFEKLLHKTWV
jgi:hypothetical protein